MKKIIYAVTILLLLAVMSILMPVAALAVCDGALAIVHDQLDDPGLVAAGAWEWNGFGFDTAPDIPGPGTPGCVDIDGDGRSEPVILGRTTP